MKILIINLPASIERLHFQQKQFSKLGLVFEILPAVSITNISEQQYQQQAFGWQRPLRKVELACFLSHKTAWEKVVELNQPCLILEDDAVLVKNSREVLESIEKNKFSDIDLINLEVRSRKKIVSKQPKVSLLNGQFKLFELYQERTGTGGYMIYPSGAKKLLTRLQNVSPAPADAFIFSDYSLNSLQIEPALLIQEDQMVAYGLTDQLQLDSIIGRSEHHKPVYHSLSEKIVFKQRRLVGQLAMAIRYIQVMPKAEKRFIALNKTDFDWIK